MRPGPGLVVMALAFISGARRGTTTQLISPSQRGKLGNSEITSDGTGILARVNPWLSACDLAQPSTTPDLQGQCSAGTLPVAWVNEGPGPPKAPQCPHKCPPESMDNNNNNNKKHKNNINSSKGNTLMHNNNYNNNKKGTDVTSSMEKGIINDYQQQQQCLVYLGDTEESSPAHICNNKSSRAIATKLRSIHLKHCCERSAYSALHNTALDDVLSGDKNLCVRSLNDIIEMDSLASRITCEFNEILMRYDCRQAYSIKHGCRDCLEAYRRWVCSTLIPYFAEPHDIRKMADSTLSTSTATSAAYTSNNSINSSITTVNMTANTSNSLSNDQSNSRITRSTNLSDPVKDPSGARPLRRPKRRTETIRKRIRPCLSVCQTVEQNCPYMLPGDRAPAHPTQYAGEPTFLCLDPNIPETGEQMRKSNTGGESCCYQYCGTGEICAHCDTYNKSQPKSANPKENPQTPSSSDNIPISSSSSSSSSSESNRFSNINANHWKSDATSEHDDEQQQHSDYLDWDNVLPEPPVCPNIQITVQPPRCFTPYQSSLTSISAGSGLMKLALPSYPASKAKTKLSHTDAPPTTTTTQQNHAHNPTTTAATSSAASISVLSAVAAVFVIRDNVGVARRGDGGGGGYGTQRCCEFGDSGNQDSAVVLSSSVCRYADKTSDCYCSQNIFNYYFYYYVYQNYYYCRQYFLWAISWCSLFPYLLWNKYLQQLARS